MIPTSYYVILSALLFGTSLAGILINRQNIIVLLMCIELMLLAVNTNFLAFAQWHHSIAGEVFVFFILTVAAAEAAIGLAIVVLLFRTRGTIRVNDMTQLKG